MGMIETLYYNIGECERCLQTRRRNTHDICDECQAKLDSGVKE